MKAEQFKNKTTEYILNGLQELIEQKIDRLIGSGCIDIEGMEDSGNYGTIKAAAHAILQDIANNYRPITAEHLKESKNISLFL